MPSENDKQKHHIVFRKRTVQAELDKHQESDYLDLKVAGGYHNRLNVWASHKTKAHRGLAHTINYLFLANQGLAVFLGTFVILGAFNVIDKLVVKYNDDLYPGAYGPYENQISMALIGSAIILSALSNLLLVYLVERKPDYKQYDEANLGDILSQNQETKYLAQPPVDELEQLQTGYTYANWVKHLVGKGQPAAATELLRYAIRNFSCVPKQDKMAKQQQVLVAEYRPIQPAADAAAATTALLGSVPQSPESPLPSPAVSVVLPAQQALVEMSDEEDELPDIGEGRVAALQRRLNMRGLRARRSFVRGQQQGRGINAAAIQGQLAEGIHLASGQQWSEELQARLADANDNRAGVSIWPLHYQSSSGDEQAEPALPAAVVEEQQPAETAAATMQLIEELRTIDLDVDLGDPRFLPTMTGSGDVHMRVQKRGGSKHACEQIDIIDFESLATEEIAAILAGKKVADSNVFRMQEFHPHAGSVLDLIADQMNQSIGYTDEKTKNRGLKGLSRQRIRQDFMRGLAKPLTCRPTNDVHDLHVPLLFAEEKSMSQGLALMRLVARRPDRTEPIQWHDARALLKSVTHSKDLLDAFDGMSAEDRCNVFASLVNATEPCQVAALAVVFAGTAKRATNNFQAVLQSLMERMDSLQTKQDCEHYNSVHQLFHLTNLKAPGVTQSLSQQPQLATTVIRLLLNTISAGDQDRNQRMLAAGFATVESLVRWPLDAEEWPIEERHEWVRQAAQAYLDNYSLSDDLAIVTNGVTDVHASAEAFIRIDARKFLLALRRKEIEAAALTRALTIFWSLSVTAQRAVLQPLLGQHVALCKLFDTNPPNEDNLKLMLQSGAGLFEGEQSVLTTLLNGSPYNQKIALRLLLKMNVTEDMSNVSERFVVYLKSNMSELFPTQPYFSDARLAQLAAYFNVAEADFKQNFQITIEQKPLARRRLCLQLLQALHENNNMSAEHRGHFIFSIYREFYAKANDNVFAFFQDLAQEPGFTTTLREDSLRDCFAYMVNNWRSFPATIPIPSVQHIYSHDYQSVDFASLLPDLVSEDDTQRAIVADIIQALVRVGMDVGDIEPQLLAAVAQPMPQNADTIKERILLLAIAGLQQACSDTQSLPTPATEKQKALSVYFRRYLAYVMGGETRDLAHQRFSVNVAQQLDAVIDSSNIIDAVIPTVESAFSNLQPAYQHGFMLMGNLLDDVGGRIYSCNDYQSVTYDGTRVVQLLQNIMLADEASEDGDEVDVPSDKLNVVIDGLLRFRYYMMCHFQRHSNQQGKLQVLQRISNLLKKALGTEHSLVTDKMRVRVATAIIQAILNCKLQQEQQGDLIEKTRSLFCAHYSALAFIQAIQETDALLNLQTPLQPSYTDYLSAESGGLRENLYAPYERQIGHDELADFFRQFVPRVDLPEPQQLLDIEDEDNVVEAPGVLQERQRLTQQKELLAQMVQHPQQRETLVLRLAKIVVSGVGGVNDRSSAIMPELADKQYAIWAMIQQLLLIEADYPKRYQHIFWLLDRLMLGLTRSLGPNERVLKLIANEPEQAQPAGALQQQQFPRLSPYEARQMALKVLQDLQCKFSIMDLGEAFIANQSPQCFCLDGGSDYLHEAYVLKPLIVHQFSQCQVDPETSTASVDSRRDTQTRFADEFKFKIAGFVRGIIASCRTDVPDNRTARSRSAAEMNIRQMCNIIRDQSFDHQQKSSIVATLIYHLYMEMHASHDISDAHKIRLLYFFDKLIDAYRAYCSDSQERDPRLKYSIDSEVNLVLTQFGYQRSFNEIVADLAHESLMLQTHYPDEEELQNSSWHRVVDCIGNDAIAEAQFYRPCLLKGSKERLKLKEIIIKLSEVGCFNITAKTGVTKWSRLVARVLFYYFDNKKFADDELDDPLATAIVNLAEQATRQNQDNVDPTISNLAAGNKPDLWCHGVAKLYTFIDNMANKQILLGKEPLYPEASLKVQAAVAVDERVNAIKLRLGLVFARGVTRRFEEMHALQQQFAVRAQRLWRQVNLAAIKEPYCRAAVYSLCQLSNGYSGLSDFDAVRADTSANVSGHIRKCDAEMRNFSIDRIVSRLFPEAGSPMPRVDYGRRPPASLPRHHSVQVPTGHEAGETTPLLSSNG